jgi:hypothetical protein
MQQILKDVEDQIPVHYLKFEELRENPKRCLNEVF